jgi:hypothetical protein
MIARRARRPDRTAPARPDRPAPARPDRPAATSPAALVLALALILAVAGCGGSSRPAAGKKAAAKVVVAHLAPNLEACLEEWNAAANQTVRFAFDGEVEHAVGTPHVGMLVTRNAAGACSLVFTGDATDAARIWTRDAGIWAAQTVLPGETALKAPIAAATAHPNVTAAITTPPDEEDQTVGLLIPLPSTG